MIFAVVLSFMGEHIHGRATVGTFQHAFSLITQLPPLQPANASAADAVGVAPLVEFIGKEYKRDAVGVAPYCD
jgi:hypothetical protein